MPPRSSPRCSTQHTTIVSAQVLRWFERLTRSNAALVCTCAWRRTVRHLDTAIHRCHPALLGELSAAYASHPDGSARLPWRLTDAALTLGERSEYISGFTPPNPGGAAPGFLGGQRLNPRPAAARPNPMPVPAPQQVYICLDSRAFGTDWVDPSELKKAENDVHTSRRARRRALRGDRPTVGSFLPIVSRR